MSEYHKESFLTLEDICIRLKRYSFESKMGICNRYSQLLINGVGNIKKSELSASILPWELECFVMLAIKATPEYSNTSFEGKRVKDFLKMMEGIRNSDYKDLIQNNGEEFFKRWRSSLALVQLSVQEDITVKLFRYTYVFDYQSAKIDMRESFHKAFGIYYEQVMLLGAFMNLWYGTDINGKYPFIINDLLFGLFYDAFQFLTINYKDYVNQLDLITSKKDDYLTCLRPSYSYPFVERGGIIYYPLPHLMGKAVTESVLYRFTENQDELRKIIGKEVLESYVLDVLSEAKCYKDISPEKKYKGERNTDGLTVDVMATTEDNSLLFVEVKSAVPPRDLRKHDKEAYEKTCMKVAENVVQLYKNIIVNYRQFDSYNPFPEKGLFDVENCWGVLVVLEDNYVDRTDIFDIAAEKLCLDKDSDKYKWLLSHIKILSLYDVEVYSFKGISMVDVFKYAIDENDFNFSTHKNIAEFDLVNKKYKDFKTAVTSRMKSIMENMLLKGKNS